MKEQIIKILTELRPEFDFSQEGVNFIEEGMLDSFDVVNLVNDLDSTFGVSIDGIDILPENFATVESIAADIAMRWSPKLSTGVSATGSPPYTVKVSSPIEEVIPAISSSA